MGITLDKERATERFGRALVLARSDEELPSEWLERAARISTAANKTFTPMLGTALLARATDPEVDVHSLREDESDYGYSARSFAKEVLMPCCVRAGIDLRVRGSEPLNNQPFLRAARVSRDLKVRSTAIPDLDYLCDCLDALKSIGDRESLAALAAFLRVRVDRSDPPLRVAIGSNVLGLEDLALAVDDVVQGEHPGAATVGIAAAALSLVFEEVRLKPKTDSTNELAGDVGVFHEGNQTLGALARSGPLSEEDVLLFASSLKGAAVERGLVLAPHYENGLLDPNQLRFHARRLHGIELAFFSNAGQFLRSTLMMAPTDLTFSLAAFPRLALGCMDEAGVPLPLLEHWSARFSPSTVEREE